MVRMAAYGTGSCAGTCDSVRMLEPRCDRKVSPPTASALECIMYYYLSKSAPAAKIFPTVSECARPRAQQHSHRRARLNSPRPYSMRTLLRPRTGAPHFGCGCAGLWKIRAKSSRQSRALGRRLPVLVPVKIPKILQLHELDVIIRK